LAAAADIVIEQGAERLTLDAVAARAGVSKGGVMYHFPAKEALLEAMIDGMVERSWQGLEAEARKLPDAPGRELCAYVTNSLRSPDADDRVSGGLLALLASHPKLMSRVSEFYHARFQRIARGIPFERAAIVQLATEGLWLMELMNASPFTKSQRAKVARALRRMASGESEGPP
jgi:AcrR family transcriptional regulator